MNGTSCWKKTRGWGRRGQGQGWGRGEGPARGQGRRGQERFDPERLAEFLREYEPELAEKLTKLRQQDPQRFRWQLFAIARIYGPVMAQMEHNPEMGKLSLKRIRLDLRTKQALKKIKKLESKTFKDAEQAEQAKAKARTSLCENVSKLFDVILEQQQRRLQEAQERLDTWAPPKRLEPQGPPAEAPGFGKGRGSARGTSRGIGRSGSRGRGTGMGRGAGMYPGEEPVAGRAHRELRARLEQHEESLKRWRDNKEQIVENRVKELLAGHEPFPWGR